MSKSTIVHTKTFLKRMGYSILKERGELTTKVEASIVNQVHLTAH
jgi:hypothetical protein